MGAGVFISSTGTFAGKTFVGRGIVTGLRQLGLRVTALKPLETGCAPDAVDADALARAAGRPELACDPTFWRAQPPVSPYAATLMGGPAVDLASLVQRIRELSETGSFTLVEGAGGLLVPIDARHDMSDLARELGFPLILVAPNRLGVLSHTLTAVEAAERRRLLTRAVVLTDPSLTPDSSSATNAQILTERLTLPVVQFPHSEDDDTALAAAAAPLLRILGVPSRIPSRPPEA